ncbi:hypothetical protein ACL02R_28565 [Streptomyces sp. MS19]|uniref:hypothetical protein n=1 Tax=Streptomyces sp. MS19 TaxID=3385972 RepID=UPI00399FA08D
MRETKGWSLQDLVNLVAARVGGAARRNKAWMWENRDVVPDWPTQVAIAAELNIPEAQLRELPWPNWLPAGDPIRTDYAWNQSGSFDILNDLMEFGVRDRRGFMKLTGAALVTVAHEWLRAEPAVLTAALSGGRVSNAFADQLEAGLPRLRLLEAERGGRQARRLIDAELGVVTEVLTNASYSSETGRRLMALAAELGRMAGWASFDAGLHSAAQRYWTAALHAAHTAQEQALGSNILKSMSLQCYDFEDPQQALLLAHCAYEGANAQSTPRTKAMLALREARAHAALGNAPACERLLSEAETVISRSSTELDPAWIAYFDDAEMCAQIGTCYLDLGSQRGDRSHLGRAEKYLDMALIRLPATKTRDRATYVTRRASVQARLGDYDRAAALLAEAVPLVQLAPSQRNVKRARAVRARMALPRHDTRMLELDTRLAALAAA